MLDHVRADHVVEDATGRKLEGLLEVALVVLRELLGDLRWGSHVDAHHGDTFLPKRRRQQSLGATEVEHPRALGDRVHDLHVRARLAVLEGVVHPLVHEVATATDQVQLV